MTLSNLRKGFENPYINLLYAFLIFETRKKETLGLFLCFFGSLSTVVGDEKLCARENDFRSLSLYVQSDENLGSKVLEVTKS
ncbi:hypothetical protein ACVRZC_09125, partial [Streptococcus hyointestinalis]